ncbi:acyltransferase [Bacillus sp. USDA818B3_A]|uniref:acyltransferase n=1 Tax=Bacillus sp. USDA818B3_A TaxID=2698834 RepID=UPI0013705E7B|nr:acyltransferase [Bacillus sp. USDA818B3_A]
MNIVSSLINNVVNKYKFRKNGLEIRPDLKIYGQINIRGKNIKFGKGIRIHSSKKSNVIGGDTQTVFKTISKGQILIGDNCGISNSTFISQSMIKIDNNVMIGGSCKFYDTDFHSIDYQSRMAVPDVTVVSKPIHIEEGVFIGAHSIILKGVTIGKYSVIGAGSVVASNIPEGEIWAGNPAKFIKRVPKI